MILQNNQTDLVLVPAGQLTLRHYLRISGASRIFS